jgi:DNA-binding transcriptional ArsR family regulator
MKTSAPAPTSSAVKLKHLASVLHQPVRWRILKELAKGEALPVWVLAGLARSTPPKVSKHMAVLRKAGLVTVGYGRLYKLSPNLKPEADGTRLDLGHCVLKLDAEY